MSIKRFLKRMICFVLVISMMTPLVGCSTGKGNGSDSGNVANENDSIVMNGVEVNDSFVTLEIRGLEEAGITVDDIDLDEILVNCIEVNGIESIEVEVTSINDEFVYLAYQNFVSVYGDDFDLKEFLKDAGIGCGCILICVTLSTVAGPVGTYFGAIITSQFTMSSVVIGAAIDAAVSAYQAYQEGGDVSYIIGHMLNGVADGFKWSAMLAPVAGAFDGIKTLRAVAALRKVPGFENISDKEARKIFEALSEILSKSGDAADNLTDDVIKELYNNLSEEITGEISEELIRDILTNRSLITKIVRKFNPFNVSSDVLKAMQDSFLRRAGFSDDVGKELLKNIKNGTINSLDDITDTVAREFIEKNMYEFVECFGGSLSKDFIDGCLKASMGDDAFNLIKNDIAQSNTLYIDLIEKVGKDSAEKILSDSNNLILLQLRYGSSNVNKLLNASVLYQQMRKANTTIPDDQLRTVLNGLLDGSYSSIDEIKTINNQIAVNLCGSGGVVSQCVKSLGKEKALSGLLDDFAITQLENIGITSSYAEDIIKNQLTKNTIIEKYGEDVYRSLFADRIVTNQTGTITITANNFNNCMNCLAMQSSVNETLVRDVTTDALKNQGFSDDVIQALLGGMGISECGITDAQAVQIYSIIADYYRLTDYATYSNYVKEIAEIRGNYISSFMETYRNAGNTIRNERYIGCVMEPSGTDSALIKAKYGDIYMSSQGFAILDDYAIARVELDGLTGLNNGADDIARANLAHHGTQTSIPGYTWHHLEDGKTLILVPTELHEAYRHTGGADLLREGLKEALDD